MGSDIWEGDRLTEVVETVKEQSFTTRLIYFTNIDQVWIGFSNMYPAECLPDALSRKVIKINFMGAPLCIQFNTTVGSFS